MSSLPDRPNTALLVVDVQNQVVASAYRRDEVVDNIRSLVDRARAQEVPVIWVQHAGESLVPDTDDWQYVPELVRQDSEPLVHKTYGDSFEATTLDSELSERGVVEVGVNIVDGRRCDDRFDSGSQFRGFDGLGIHRLRR